MALLDGKQIRNSSTSLSKLSGVGLVNFTTGGTMSFDAGSVLRTDDTNILIGTDVVNKNYVDSFVTGLHIKESVEAISTTASLVLSGDGQLVDGWTLSTGDRVLVNAQAGVGVATASNGIYVVATGSWTRALDSDGNPTNEVEKGDFTFVKHGDLYTGTGWVLSTSNAVDANNILVGTESQLWTQFSESTDIQAGDGLIQVGQDFQVNTGTGLTISSDQVIIANTGVTAATYGDANSVATFTVNAQGQLTFADNVDINITSTQVSDFASASETTIFDNANFVDGTTIDFTVTTGDSVSAEVALGSLTASRFDIINSASASQGWKLGYNTSGQFEWLDPTLSDISEVVAGSGLTGGGTAGSVTLSINTDNGLSIDGDNVILGGTLSQNTTINANNYDFIVTGADIIFFTSSVFDVEADGFISLDAGTGSVQIFADDAITLSASSSVDLLSNGDLVFSFAQSTITDNSGNGLGLVYTSDYSGTFVTNSLVSKEYVDNAVVVSSNPYYAGDGLDLNGSTFSLDPNSAGNGLTYSSGVYNVNLGVNSGLTFSGDDIIIEVDGTTIQIVNGVLKGAAQGVLGVTAGNGLSGGGTGSYVTLDVNLGANSGLTFSGDDIIIDSAIAGDGLSFASGVLNVKVTNGLEIISDKAQLGGTLSQTTTINADGYDLTIGGVGIFSVTSSNEINLNSTDGVNDFYLRTTAADVQAYAGSINDYSNLYLQITDAAMTTTVGASTYSTVVVNTSVAKMEVSDGVSANRFNLSIGAIGSGDGSVNNYFVVTDNLGSKGLVYSGDYTANFTTYSLITKGYVDAQTVFAGSGLTANGSSFDVEVNTDSIEIDGNNQLRLKNTITGARTFSDTVTIQGDLIVEGTQSIINTENIYIEDNIITLNATYSGPYNVVDAGIEVNLGGGTFAALIWDSSESLWAVGFSGSTSTIITEAGTGLTKSGNTLSINTNSFANGLAGSGLTSSAGVINVGAGTGIIVNADDVTLDYNLISGAGITASGGTLNIGAGTGIIVNVDDVTLDYNLISGAGITSSGGTLNIGAGTGIIVNADDVAIDFGSVTGFGLTQNGSQISVDFTSISTSLAGDGLSANGGTLSVNVGNGLEIISDTVQLGGTLSQTTTIEANGNTLTLNNLNQLQANTSTTGDSALLNLASTGGYLQSTLQNGTQSTIGVESDNAYLESIDGVSTNQLKVWSTPQIIGDGSEALFIVTDDIASKGLVYAGDYTANFTTYSLVTKAYVDAQTVVVGNGLEVISGTVQLGGTLSQATTIDANSNDLFVSNANIFRVLSSGTDFASVDITTTEATLGFTKANGTFSQVQAISDYVALNAGDNVGTNELQVRNSPESSLDGSSNNYFIISDTIGSKGLVYYDDYTANFTTHSVVTKGYVDSQQSLPEYSQRNLTPLATTPNANNEPTGLTLSFTPSDYSRVSVYVNGQLQFLGNGTASGVDCYFTGDSGSTARLITALVVGDELYWNGNSANAGFRLDNTDRLDIIYEK